MSVKPLRSVLYVPGDKPRAIAKARTLGADAVILDLEDAVAPSAKDAARAAIAGFLRAASRDIALFVRINPLDGGLADADLDAVVDARPSGYVLPKAEGSASVADLIARLAARGRESREQIGARLKRGARIGAAERPTVTIANDSRPEVAGELLVAAILSALARPSP